MKLSFDTKEKLVKEIRFAVDGMRKSDKLNDKMYFFSAVWAMVDRIYNIEYDPELVFIYQVTRQAFDTINAKLAIASQKDMGIGSSIPTQLFDRLYGCLDELATKIEKGQKTHAVLQDIAIIGYSTTGNGSYLYTKGILTI
jgi:hypothetical protein